MPRHLASPDSSLSAESQIWRYALAIALSVAVWSQVALHQIQKSNWLLLADISLGALAYWLMTQRRKQPMYIALAINALAGVSALASGPQLVANVSAMARRKPPEIATLSVAFLTAAMIFRVVQPTFNGDPPWPALVLNIIFAGVQVGWGIMLGHQRQLVEELQERAETAESEQEDLLETAKSHERAVIAREMHDVLAHRITQLSMQAGAMAYRNDLTAEELRNGVALIQTQANEALADLRGVLGVLRDPGTGETINRPQPTYGDLPSLFAEATASGVTIQLTNMLDSPERMSPNTGRTLYRIMQEAITNARKHALGSTVYVELVGSEGEGVTFIARNPIISSRPLAPGSGLGLVGLAERAQLLGGRLSHGTRGNVFELRGWLPWQA